LRVNEALVAPDDGFQATSFMKSVRFNVQIAQNPGHVHSQCTPPSGTQCKLNILNLVSYLKMKDCIKGLILMQFPKP